jgi:hypothetical protein
VFKFSLEMNVTGKRLNGQDPLRDRGTDATAILHCRVGVAHPNYFPIQKIPGVSIPGCKKTVT